MKKVATSWGMLLDSGIKKIDDKASIYIYFFFLLYITLLISVITSGINIKAIIGKFVGGLYNTYTIGLEIYIKIAINFEHTLSLLKNIVKK